MIYGLYNYDLPKTVTAEIEGIHLEALLVKIAKTFSLSYRAMLSA